MQTKISDSYTYLATCPEELKPILALELEKFDVQDITHVYRGIKFRCGLKKAYEMHLNLKTASRIFRILKTQRIKEQKDIFNCSRALSWHNIISSSRTYKINASNSNKGKDELPSNLISKLVRHGLEEKFNNRKVTLPTVELKDPQVTFMAHLQQDILTLCVDTSKIAMHKRGYKSFNHPAPLKETLASALIGFCGYDGTQPFLDPMCGSGTLPVEACYLALNKSPLIHRSKGDFGFEWLKDFDNKLWQEVCNEQRKQKKESIEAPIYARDISEEYVSKAQSNALKARVEKFINFKACDFFEMTPPPEKGIMIMNLPYGERLDKGYADTSEEYYKELGDHFKNNYQGWKIGVLAAENSPYKFIGLKPSKKIPLQNGSIPCKLLIFEVYEGSKKFKR